MHSLDHKMILFRASLAEEEELKCAQKYFKTTDSRLKVPVDGLVIPRYSVLPFYKELEADVALRACHLINTYSMHCYVADIKNWYEDLKNFTPQTYFDLSQVPNYGPFVVKGATNSRKHLWNTHMFAENREDVIKVYGRLMDDSMISEQPIYVREYVPLKRLANGINGLPISEEYRFFFLGDRPIAGGYYWQNYADDLGYLPDHTKVPYSMLEQIGNIVSKHINFYVVDIAKAESGEWVLIELNDGQMSGLSTIDPELFYKALFDNLNRFHYIDEKGFLGCNKSV